MSVCKRYRVTGQVQGVFFRAATREEARRLGLTGWVRNLPNGEVEVVACGDDTQLQDLVEWLWKGPPSARVQNVTGEAVEVEEPVVDFKVR